jgi:hypothetical protein
MQPRPKYGSHGFAGTSKRGNSEVLNLFRSLIGPAKNETSGDGYSCGIRDAPLERRLMLRAERSLELPETKLGGMPAQSQFSPAHDVFV